MNEDTEQTNAVEAPKVRDQKFRAPKPTAAPAVAVGRELTEQEKRRAAKRKAIAHGRSVQRAKKQ